jgi:hypothetical protein
VLSPRENSMLNPKLNRWHHILKSKFLHGKRNRRVDHLLYILVRKAVPYFAARHRRQAFGFDGPDLELKHWQNLEERAREIARSDIQVNEEGNYCVHSQSDPERWYNVDHHAGYCDCSSYPLISFCKHISAVQSLFPESCKLVLFRPEPEVATAHSILTIEPHGPSPNEIQVETCQPLHNDADSIHFTRIGQKLMDISSSARENQLQHLKPVLLDLEAGLDQLRARNAGMLPKQVPVAPNQHSWPETAMVMAAQPKAKRKRHTDPYSGGEKSGKKAKPDARAPRSVMVLLFTAATENGLHSTVLHKPDENTPPTNCSAAPAPLKIFIRIPAKATRPSLTSL